MDISKSFEIIWQTSIEYSRYTRDVVSHCHIITTTKLISDDKSSYVDTILLQSHLNEIMKN